MLFDHQIINIEKRLKIILVLILLGMAGSTYAQEYLINENFTNPEGKWTSFSLDGTSPLITYSPGNLKIVTEEASKGGIYNGTQLTGNFLVEVDFSKDKNVMVALFQKNTDGTINKNNFTAICIDSIEDHIEVYVTDKQNGIENILDNTYKVDPEKYRHKLSGSVYSLPFTGTNKKLRIFRNNLSGFIHFYYSVKKEVNGVVKTGWMELFPSKEWGGQYPKYLLALMSNGGTVDFSQITVKQIPERDKNDTETGFKATKRDFTWAGHTGKSIVISFGDDFAYRDKDYKWVFWDKFNYIPAWYFSNDLQYTYEFIETWDSGIPGCFEPMSDRLLRYSHVELLEDNPVRKVVQWHYALINPDYRYPDDGREGNQIPEVDEYYYIYTDGQIVRRIQYFPKLDTPSRSWHELTEAIVISGVQSNAAQHLEAPALSIFNLHNNFRHFFGENTVDHFDSNDWDAYIFSTHFKYHPDAVGAFIQDFIPGKQISMVLDWHSPDYKFAHWPVNTILYEEPHKTNTPWKEMISHTSLIGGSARTGTDWNSNFKTKDDRKYREWGQLIFLNAKKEFVQEQNIVYSWKGDVSLKEIRSGFVYNGYNRNQKVFEFDNDSACNRTFKAEIKPDNILINPVLRISNWGNCTINVKINGGNARFKYHIYANKDLIVWINTQLTTQTKIEITPEGYLGIDNRESSHILPVETYPNPANNILYIRLNAPVNNTLIKIMDTAGRTLYSGSVNTNPFKVDMRSYSNGLYIVNITNSKFNISRKIIKK